MEIQNTKWLQLLVLLTGMMELSATQKVVCYLGSWATYRPGDGRFEAEYIDTSLCTHIIYSFVGIGGDGSIKILDSWNDLSVDGGKGAIQRFNNLKSRNPSLKTIVAIGGWNQGSAVFSSVVNNIATRRNLVRNAVEFLNQHGFDGFDLDWEYPVQRGGSPSDKSAFTALIQEMRQEFDKHGYSLSAAVPASRASVETSYDVIALGKYLDFINLMTYDLHGSWEPVTGHNAPLHARSSETGSASTLNVHSSVQHWIEKGVPRNKLILGVPSYGRTWTLRSTSNAGVGAPASGPGNAGKYTSEPGMIGYNEICLDMKQGGWAVHWDDEQKVPYAAKGSQWVSYDNPESIKIKAEYAINERLGGVMLWSLETDDFNGICNGEKFPILKAVKEAFMKGDESQIKNPSNDVSEEKEDDKKPESSAGMCKTVGYEGDQNDCTKFYYCMAVNDKIIPYPFKCPEGLAFDRSFSTCNHKHLVNC